MVIVSEQAETMKEWDYDLVVIGGGSGGYAAARTAVGLGLKNVAVIEGGREVGGLCILRGCMPTKALLYAAEVLHLARQARVWGLDIPQAGYDFAKVMARKDAVIGEFAAYRRKQLQAGAFDFIREQARFVEPRRIRLASGREVTAAHFVVSTGSIVRRPSLPGLEEVGYLTSDDALDLSRAPKSLIVLGGGAVAVEFAQFFQRLGTKVSLIQRSRTILKEFDEDAAIEAERALRAEGMALFTGATLLSAAASKAGKAVRFKHEGEQKTAEAEEIFMALGRSPNTAGLGLDKAGVETAQEGRIVCDARMQSSAPHIFAAGDCAGPHEIVHLAVRQGEIAARNIALPEQSRGMEDRLSIGVVFTDPQVARTGWTERELQSRGVQYRAACYPFDDHGKSILMNARRGFAKLIADAKTGEILGGSCVGPSGGELIHEITIAMAKQMTVGELSEAPHYHPTLAEIWSYPAEELAAQIQEVKADAESMRRSKMERTCL